MLSTLNGCLHPYAPPGRVGLGRVLETG